MDIYTNILKIENKFIAESIERYLKDIEVKFEKKEDNGYYVITAYCENLFEIIEKISGKWSDEKIVYTISNDLNTSTYLYIGGIISEIVSTNTYHYEESTFDDSLRGIIKVITASKNGNEVATIKIAYIEKLKNSESNVIVYREVVNRELEVINQKGYDTLIFNINPDVEEFDKTEEYYGSECESYSEYEPVVELRNNLSKVFPKGSLQFTAK